MKEPLVSVLALSVCMICCLGAEPGDSADIPKRKPKVAVLKFENFTTVRQFVTVENPALFPQSFGLLSRNSQGDLQWKPSGRRQESYSETTRALIEMAIGEWDEIEVIERQHLDGLERELELNDSRGGNRTHVERFQKEHGADYLVFGKILGVWEEEKRFNGYGLAHLTHLTKAHLYVAVVAMADERLAASFQTTGVCTISARQFGSDTHSDPSGEALRDAVRQLTAEPKFRSRLLSRLQINDLPPLPSGKLVSIDFNPNVRRAEVYLDDTFLGVTPFTRELVTGRRYKVRLQKPGYAPWEAWITAELDLAVSPELQLLPP